MGRDKSLRVRLDSEEQAIIQKAFKKQASTLAREFLLNKALEVLSEEELEEIEGFKDFKKANMLNGVNAKDFYKLKIIIKK